MTSETKQRKPPRDISKLSKLQRLVLIYLQDCLRATYQGKALASKLSLDDDKNAIFDIRGFAGRLWEFYIEEIVGRTHTRTGKPKTYGAVNVSRSLRGLERRQLVVRQNKNGESMRIAGGQTQRLLMPKSVWLWLLDDATIIR